MEESKPTMDESKLLVEFDKILDGYKSGGENDDKSEDGGLSIASGLSSRSAGSGFIRREKFTESMLNHDVFAPTVVHFTEKYNPQRKQKQQTRRLLVLLVVIILSVSAILHFWRLLFSFSHEAYLDIEVKMEATTTSAAPIPKEDEGSSNNSNSLP